MVPRDLRGLGVIGVANAVKTTFQRLDGTGETDEYRTDEPQGSQTLAYIDWNADRTEGTPTLYYPYRGKSRAYKERTPAKATALVTAHLTSEGFPLTGE